MLHFAERGQVLGRDRRAERALVTLLQEQTCASAAIFGAAAAPSLLADDQFAGRARQRLVALATAAAELQ